MPHPIAADRGGSFGRDTDVALARAEREGAAPGTEFRFPFPAESSPVGRRVRARRAPWRRFAIAVAGLSLAAAAWLAGNAGYLHAKAALGQHLLQRAWAAAKADGIAARPWPWADTHPLARLSVPSHRVDLLVLAGASGRTLAWGPGHVDGTALPGARGNAVVTAHRDTHFAFVGRLRPGEAIVVETASGGTRTYRVERAFVADHRALRLPADDRATTLALVTCYPFDGVDPGTPWRYAVIARAD